MPHVSHEYFTASYDPTTPLWRFMDFTKFVSLLDRQTLFFSRADLLGDPFEGSYTEVNVHMRPKWSKAMGAEEDFLSGLSDSHALMPRTTFVSCWHASAYESAAMWSLYARTGDGIAVRTSLHGLSESLVEASQNVFIGAVTYLDHTTEAVPEGNTLRPFMHKRRSYEHEREVRAVIQEASYFKAIRARQTDELRRLELGGMGLDPDDQGVNLDAVLPLPPPGLHVPVRLDLLIEQVILSPTAATWFHELVGNVLAKYGGQQPVTQSDLRSDPVY